MTSAPALLAVGISGSPSAQSKSRTLLREALARVEGYGIRTKLVDLNVLSADGLLGRRSDPDIDRAIELVTSASIIVASTPVYRATYSGLLKVFFDLLPQRSLAGKLAIAIATGGAPGHQLVIGHGLTPLFASVGAVVMPTGIYATDAEFTETLPRPGVLERIDRAVSEAVTLAERARPDISTSPPREGVATHV